MSTEPAHAADNLPAITVHAPNHAYHNVLVSVDLPHSDAKKSEIGTYSAYYDKKVAPSLARITQEDGHARLTMLIPDLPQGANRVYHLERSLPRTISQVVIVKAQGDDISVWRDEAQRRLFTRYTTHSGPNKPFFYPILTPDDHHLTRQWPMEMNPNETHDHPHHRGLWFTHGDLNGIDFWSEEVTDKVKPGKTVAKGFENVVSGPVFGGFRTRTEWRSPDDKLIATDVRDVRIYALGDDRIMDFELTMKPEGESLVWGDTKEGMFGLRVTDTLAPKPDRSAHINMPTGHMESASGLKDSAVWGKPNTWIDYYGPIGNATDSKTYGVAIFDNAQNLRHPQTWHARDYGLFAVNPFGWHDFGMGAKGIGTYTQPADKALTFRYRLLFHAGDTTEGHVAEQYQNYADPPEITVK